MEAVSALANKVVSSLFDVAENVENFKNEAEKLLVMKRRIQQQIDFANSKGELLLEGVEEWMKKADATISDATDFINKEAASKKACLNMRLCVNLSTLRHYCKTSAKKTVFLRQHQGDGKDFETRVSVPTRTPGYIDLYQRKKFENIYTHQSILNEIIQAIEDDVIQMVGIVGIGGVGKTTLASEVAAQMKNQFSDIVYLAVSQTVDAKMIQKKVEDAASKVINGEKVLIILDDIWEELKLDELGIPCGSDYMNCKITTDEDASFKRKGIMQLKLSYDYLESEVVKSCFLLCSMFPEDGFIDDERLTYYGYCLGIFNNSDSIQVAKDRVLLAIESLKSSSLLLHME